MDHPSQCIVIIIIINIIGSSALSIRSSRVVQSVKRVVVMSHMCARFLSIT